MRSALVVVVTIVLVGSGVAAAPAATPDITLRVSTASALPDRVLVAGRAPGTVRAVTIQRYTHGRWVRERRVRVGERHRFSKLLAARPGVHRYRAVTPRDRSAARTVRVPAKPPSSPAPPSDACGPRPPKPDGSSWSCTFADDFGGSALDRTKWLPQVAFATGVPGAAACAVDDGTTVRVGGGVLDLSIQRLAAPMTCRVGSGDVETQYGFGMVTTYHRFSQQYGRFEARMKDTVTMAPGLHEAFWLWPDDRVPSTEVWPVAGEIDVSETYSKYPLLSVPFLHYAADQYGPLPGVNTAWDCVAERGVWNTYRLEWSPTRLEIFVNGRSCLVNNSADPAFQKPYIVAFTAALGGQGNAYTGEAPIPATTSVDYIRVWQ